MSIRSCCRMATQSKLYSFKTILQWPKLFLHFLWLLAILKNVSAKLNFEQQFSKSNTFLNAESFKLSIKKSVSDILHQNFLHFHFY